MRHALLFSVLLLFTVPALSQKPPMPAELRETVKELQAQDMVRIELHRNRAYIDPLLWLRLNAQGKANLAKILAWYVAREQASDTYLLFLYDQQSGKRLGQYTETLGLQLRE